MFPELARFTIKWMPLEEEWSDYMDKGKLSLNGPESQVRRFP